MTQQTKKKLIAWKAVRPMVGDLGRTTWWRLIRDGKAPQPVQLTPGRIAWVESEILDWIDCRQPTHAKAAAHVLPETPERIIRR